MKIFSLLAAVFSVFCFTINAAECSEEKNREYLPYASLQSFHFASTLPSVGCQLIEKNIMSDISVGYSPVRMWNKIENLFTINSSLNYLFRRSDKNFYTGLGIQFFGIYSRRLHTFTRPKINFGIQFPSKIFTEVSYCPIEINKFEAKSIHSFCAKIGFYL